MATVVLTGLIYMICEMHIDDCNVFGDNNIEFVSRLKSIFKDSEKINYTSKQINVSLVIANLVEEGLKMSFKKIQSVLYFPITNCRQTAEELFRYGKLFKKIYTSSFRNRKTVT